jgi:tRNA(adenine34) deaminase
MNQEKIIKKMLKMAKKASNKGEIPVAALVIHNDKLISSAINNRESKNDITGHAEILAIKKASRKLKRWNLCDCDLYVSLKPCQMCMEVIKH